VRRRDADTSAAETGAALMPKMDPQLDAMLRANPNRTPSEATQMLYGKKTADIELTPPETIKQLLLRKLLGDDSYKKVSKGMAVLTGKK